MSYRPCFTCQLISELFNRRGNREAERNPAIVPTRDSFQQRHLSGTGGAPAATQVLLQHRGLAAFSRVGIGHVESDEVVDSKSSTRFKCYRANTLPLLPTDSEPC